MTQPSIPPSDMSPVSTPPPAPPPVPAPVPPPVPSPQPAPPPAPTPPIQQNIAYTLNYQDGMFLTAAEMTTAQNYFANWLQLQNQLLYTPGVLSGLLVSNPNGNTLSVASGAGIDAAGHFVILPDGAGNTITVPDSAANPSYVGLVYPGAPQPVADQPYTVNMAGALQVANSPYLLPTNSIVLALVKMTANGGVDSVNDLRTPVTSRLPANLGLMELQATQSPQAGQSRHGVAAVRAGDMRKQGDSVSQVVYYQPQHQRVFDRNPQVLVTVLGSFPYATAVSEVGPDQFTLTLTAVLAPVADNLDSILVNWLAYV